MICISSYSPHTEHHSTELASLKVKQDILINTEAAQNVTLLVLSPGSQRGLWYGAAQGSPWSHAKRWIGLSLILRIDHSVLLWTVDSLASFHSSTDSHKAGVWVPICSWSTPASCLTSLKNTSPVSKVCVENGPPIHPKHIRWWRGCSQRHAQLRRWPSLQDD